MLLLLTKGNEMKKVAVRNGVEYPYVMTKNGERIKVYETEYETLCVTRNYEEEFKNGRKYYTAKWMKSEIEEINEPEYEPWPDDMMPNLERGEWIVSKTTGIEFHISRIDRRYCTLVYVYFGGSWHSNKRLFEDYTKLDGTPIGRQKQ